MKTETERKVIKLTQKQSTTLFHYPNKVLRVRRNFGIFYIDKYSVTDWTGKEYPNIKVIDVWGDEVQA